MKIDQLQDQIIDEFAVLAGDRESTIFYIMDLGQKLPEFDDADRKDENLIKGCLSKVWLTAEIHEGKMEFKADSNTDITKGLISLLIRIFNGQPADEVVNADLHFIQQIGMSQMIGSQRSNGFASMIKQMKLFALTLGRLDEEVKG